LNDSIIQLEYIREKLLFIKLKVEQDTKSGLFDINKYGEDIFMHLLNSSYGFKISNANDVFYDNFPAIDLIDEENELLIQVTSTLSTQKIYSTIKKKDENKELKKYKDYKLKMCYIAGAPDFNEQESLNLKEKGINEEDLLDLDTIISIAQNDQQKCNDIYYTLNQRLDSKAYNLDVENHFNKFEELNKKTTKKLSSYNQDFDDFLQSNNNVLEVFGTGGHGKSHLLKHLASLKNEYTPIIFTKQDNVEADLQKLDFTKQYLLLYDDIDRFLENGITSIFSSLIDSGSKIIISYRTASKPLVEEKILKFNALKTQELHITWSKDEIKDLILLINPKATDYGIDNLNAHYNSNPYLITQAMKGGIDEIKSFSKNILTDSIAILKIFEIKEFEIEELLFRIALLSPCPRNLVDINDNDKIDQLLKVGVLRELNNKIRFNPDVLGDLYLASFIKKYENKYKEIALEYMSDNLELIITNLSYVLSYEDNNGLELFFKDIVAGWVKDEDYRSSNLRILYRIVRYAPFESFMYLKKTTTILEAKENEHPKDGVMMQFMSKISEVDFNISDEYINLGSIVPIVSKLISGLKKEKDSGILKIKHLIDFLVSTKVQSFPEPYFANHSISSVFNNMIIPYESKNNDVIIEALEEMKKWTNSDSVNVNELNILKSSIGNLLMGSLKSMYIDTERIEFDTSKENIRKVIDKAKEIVLIMINSSNTNLKCRALDILSDVGNSINEELQSKNEHYYYKIIIELFENIKEQLSKDNDYKFLSKLEKVLFNAMAHRKHKDEAFSLFLDIPRTPFFIFNQLLADTTFTVYNLDKFIDEYHKQEDVHNWLFDKYYDKHDSDISDDEIDLYNYFIKSCITEDDFINFINSLHFIGNSINSYKFSNVLNKLLKYWYEQNPQLFKELAVKGIANISNNDASKTIDNFLFDSELTTLDIDCIDDTLDISELKRYVENSFRNKDIALYQKLLIFFKKEEKENISWFVDTSFTKIYFILKNDSDFSTYKPYMHELLDLIIKHRITPSIYLIFILEYLEKNNISFEFVKNKIRQVIYIPSLNENLEEIKIQKEDLLKLFHFLDYKLEDILDRVFLKILKAEWNKYNKDHNIEECYLIKDYIKNYEDYKVFVHLVIDYYYNFTHCQTNKDGSVLDYKIDINYFFSSLKNEDFKRYINELIENNDKEEILVLINVIPTKAKYKELLINALNFLDTNISNEAIITLLTKDRIPAYVYIKLLNDKISTIHKGFTYDYVMEEINDQEELFIYISKNILDINVLSEIKEIVEDIKEKKNTVSEINLEQSFTK